jgi:hypothetical protein
MFRMYDVWFTKAMGVTQIGVPQVVPAAGLRFVVPVRTVHAGPNPKDSGPGWGVTNDNLVSDQFTGLNAIARQRLNLNLIASNWDDLLRLAGSLKGSKIRGVQLLQKVAVYCRVSTADHSCERQERDLIAQTGLQFDLSTPQGKLIASLMAGLAEFERDLLRERIRSGIATAKAKGRTFGRKAGDRPKSNRLAASREDARSR